MVFKKFTLLWFSIYYLNLPGLSLPMPGDNDNTAVNVKSKRNKTLYFKRSIVHVQGALTEMRDR